MKQRQFTYRTFFFLFVLGILTTTFGQTKKYYDSRGTVFPDSMIVNISVHYDEVDLLNVLSDIAEKGGFHLNYSENTLPDDYEVTHSDENKSAVDILRRILIGTDLDYVLVGPNQIVIVRKKEGGQSSTKQKFTISGFVTDAHTGESLIGANVYLSSASTGASTNIYGFYSITLPEKIFHPRFSFVGYQSRQLEVELTEDVQLNIALSKALIASDTVLVTAQIESEITKTRVGTIELIPGKLNSIPTLFGEQDILKTLHLLPGVSSYREGDAGLYVRGGDSDQNLLLLDEAPVYNAFHFFGFISVFNSEAIRNVKVIKGPAPARYGGKLSSVIDVHMKEGNLKKFEGVAGLGLIYSRLTLQGPFQKDKGSFMFSGRRTYLDLFKYLSGDEELMDSGLYFYDLNLKANYIFDDNNRLYLSGYFGNDVIKASDVLDVSWGNKTATLRWNHIFNNNLFSNTSFVVSNFSHSTGIDAEDENDDYVEVISKVQDITLKSEFQYFYDVHNTFNFGANYVRHDFLPADINVRGFANIDIQLGKKNADEFSFYISDELRYWENFRIDLGLRYTIFSVKGEKDIFDIDDFDSDINVGFHGDEDEVYSGIEPRLIANYLINETSSLKFAVSRNHQYLHMVSGSNSSTPFDVWQPASKLVKPLKSDQVSFGYYKNIPNYNAEYSVELFYKDMDNLLDFRDGANLFYSNFFESEYIFGVGRAYGAEFFLKKSYGPLTGWIGYTLSRSERKFHDINYGEWFPAKFDKTHDLSIVLMYQASERWNLSANWVYSTGNAITMPYGKYELDGKVFEAYSPRNAYRVPAFHRLDLSVSYENDVGGVWNLSLYNAYSRKNTYTIWSRNKSSIPGAKEAVSLSLFSIVPSLTYTLRF